MKKWIQIKTHKQLSNGSPRWLLHLQSSVFPTWWLSLDLSGSGTEPQGLKRFGEEAVEWETRTALSEAWHPLLWTGKYVKRMVRWGLGGKNVGRPRLWHLLCNVKTWLVELVLTVVQMKAKKTHVTHYIHWQNITKSLFRGQKVQKVCILSSEFIYRGQSTVDGCPIIKSGQIYLYSAFENNTDLQVSYRKLES